MADNVLADPGTGGATFATDGIGAAPEVHYPYVKLVDGTADSTAKIPGDATNGLDVDVTRVSGTVTVAGTVTANIGTVGTLATETTLAALNTKVTACNTGAVVVSSGAITADTELPAAAALADAAANPTSPIAGAAILQFNGTTWDRARGDTTNGIDVDVTRVTGVVSVQSNSANISTETTLSTLNGKVTACNTGAVVVSSGSITADTELAAAAALADAAANPTVPTVGAAALGFNGTTWDRLRSDTTNGLDVDVTRLPALVAGTANIGDVDVASIAAGDNNIGNVDIVTMPAVAGAAAHDAAVSGNPVRVAGRAQTANLAAVAADDTCDIVIFDQDCRVDHHSVADTTYFPFMQDARGNKVKNILFAFDYHRMPGIISALIAHDIINLA